MSAIKDKWDTSGKKAFNAELAALQKKWSDKANTAETLSADIKALRKKYFHSRYTERSKEYAANRRRALYRLHSCLRR